MIHTNEWSPDTCGCVLTFTWDDAVEATQRTHTCVEVVPCSAHAHLPSGIGATRSASQPHTPGDNATTWAAVHEENQRKNVALGALIELPAMAPFVVSSVTDQGDSRPAWAKPPAFSFDQNRVLHLSFGLATAVAPAVQSALDTAVGAGTTVVE